MMAASSDSRAARTNGHCATRPRRTSGSVAFKTSSGSSRASTPETTRTVLAIGSMSAVHALDERTEVREGRHGHVGRQQMARFVQTLQRAAVERGEALLIDRVEAGEAILRAVGELHVEHE